MKDKLIALCKGQIALLTSLKKSDQNVWLFSSRNNVDFNYNSEYLFLYVKEHMKQITPRYVINDSEKRKILQNKYGKEYFIETQSLHGMRNAMRAGVWFTSAGLPVYALGVGKNRLIINLWHGVPLKKIALLEENISIFKKIFFRYVFSNNYSFVVTTSDRLIPIMAKSFQIPEDIVKVWGQPRNDMLLGFNKRNKAISDYVDVSGIEKVVLYAPTYRDHGKTKWFPFDDFDIVEFERYLEEKKILFCLRPHVEEKLDLGIFSGNIVNLSSDIIDDITGNLYLFDVLITDYSSIYIDFLLLNRPIIFLPYDQKEYLETRGLNFEYDSVTPGEKPDTYELFIQALENCFNRDSYGKERERVNEIFNQVKVPCSQMICDRVIAMLEK